MAITSYVDEPELAGFMHTTLGNDELATALDWSVENSDYQDAVDETLLVMGVSDVSTLTATLELRQLRAVARAEVWRLVMQRTAGDYDMSQEGDSYKRSQLPAHAKAMHKLAKDEAISLGVDDYDATKKYAAFSSSSPTPSDGYSDSYTVIET